MHRRATLIALRGALVLAGCGGTTLADDQTYIRVDGPAAWIEFSNQAGRETPGVHHHTIFRDQTADYGAGA